MPVEFKGDWRFQMNDTFVYAYSINWAPPPEIANLPPELSIVRLRNTCRWSRTTDSEFAHPKHKTECGKISNYLPKYCPNCGRQVELAS